ncbi:MAG TPA: 3-phosphoshikimate 1-carboxyvinyltransferase [Solirubrobacteraceae bacterium]|jgi:3-phosphoshikimate 1-carboxyvinyltransferase|nr:3-phosphoshikimate 1-carboxyvinyltransferase [Solirubrobacteraceae bacterium]
MNVRVAPAEALRGELAAPADKSISHRAVLLGAMASDPVRVTNFLPAADTLATLAAVRALGAIVEQREPGGGSGAITERPRDAGPNRGWELMIRGTGLRNANELETALDVGNAGTLMRLLPGWLAAQEGRSFTLDGDASIRRRPVDRVAKPLKAMGAHVRATRGRFAPFTVTGARLRAIDYELPVASAQVKSCVLLAALAADGTTRITEPSPSRDHTERMLVRAGVTVQRHEDGVSVTNCDELVLEEVAVPGDLSSAAFAIVAALLVPRSRLLIRNVGVNWTRTGFLRILARMGAIVLGDLEEPNRALGGEEPVCDLDIAAAPLVGTEVGAEEVPLAIDELPLVALLGCFAEGDTVVRGASELRVKESDRIAAVVEGLSGLGARIEALDDGFVVTGTGGLRGGRVDARGDHRLAMLGAVAGLASRDGVEVVGMEAAAVSYPDFLHDIASLQ